MSPSGEFGNQSTLNQNGVILLLGDGNFSFALALSRFLRAGQPEALQIAYRYLHKEIPPCQPQHQPRQYHVLATSFDTYDQVIDKHPESRDILRKIGALEFAQVMHGVNAWELQTTFQSRQAFDAIIWNHPHLGTEDFRLHRFLMAHFFKSCADVLAPNGHVCVSLVSGQEERWDLVGQANRAGLICLGSDEFIESEWPGYVVKRNTSGHSFKNTKTRRFHGDMTSRVFWFGVKPGGSSVSGDGQSVVNGSGGSNAPNTAYDSPYVWRPSVRRMSESAPTFPCLLCNKRLRSDRGLRSHVHAVHELQLYGDSWAPDAPRMLNCSDCDRAFAREADLRQHQINKHTTVDLAELGLNSMSTNNSFDHTHSNGSSPISNHPTDQKAQSTTIDSQVDSNHDYDPCKVCGQATLKGPTGRRLHLETLKPLVGMGCTCPRCNSGFVESRALLQHYKFHLARDRNLI
ncbi:hypothetical protein SeMB42_g02098 [Synchytrium endobioticum]|uniref:C2H2-type domain-containing protein n=1 Tax=Synchytrium endobioticum TaxID=286115 RepID=A0A507D7Q4_9FUNG|nr:hypothetical protein SeLEV6574_g02584 [Synchytrium endobioticum]TPX50873.1 hypothetical protein SeMB42_g02098 [Synchytrium endobioticum]